MFERCYIFEKEETEVVFSHVVLHTYGHIFTKKYLPKIDRPHRITNAKRTFVNFKKTRKTA